MAVGAGIRLGRISYVNMAPLFFRLDADVEEATGVPTELNRRLLAGEVDLAPVSSIAYARNAGQPAGPAAGVRFLGGRGRLHPAGVPRAADADPLGCGDARERHLGRPRQDPAARGGARSARRRGGCDAPDRRRGAAQQSSRIPTPHYDLGPAVAGANGTAHGLRGVRLPRPGARRGRSRRGGAARRPPPRAGRAGAARPRRERALRIPGRVSSPATSRSCGTASDRASEPGS